MSTRSRCSASSSPSSARSPRCSGRPTSSTSSSPSSSVRPSLLASLSTSMGMCLWARHCVCHYCWAGMPHPNKQTPRGLTCPNRPTTTTTADIGWRVREDSAKLLASLLYIAYGAFFLNEVKKQYLPAWVPSLQEDKRRSYIIDRSSSVVLWILATFSCIECISAFLKVPLSSTLAFGGIGGLAFGLASKDVVSNFFGGRYEGVGVRPSVHHPEQNKHAASCSPPPAPPQPLVRPDAPLHRALHSGRHGLLHDAGDALRGESGARGVVPDAAPGAGYAVSEQGWVGGYVKARDSIDAAGGGGRNARHES